MGAFLVPTRADLVQNMAAKMKTSRKKTMKAGARRKAGRVQDATTPVTGDSVWAMASIAVVAALADIVTSLM